MTGGMRIPKKIRWAILLLGVAFFSWRFPGLLMEALDYLPPGVTRMAPEPYAPLPAPSARKKESPLRISTLSTVSAFVVVGGGGAGSPDWQRTYEYALEQAQREFDFYNPRGDDPRTTQGDRHGRKEKRASPSD